MKSSPQISAHISSETKEWMENYTQNHGLKKSYFIETAILHHLQAMRDIPLDLIIPPKVVISKKSGEQVLQSLEANSEPTSAMRKLFDNG